MQHSRFDGSTKSSAVTDIMGRRRIAATDAGGAAPGLDAAVAGWCCCCDRCRCCGVAKPPPAPPPPPCIMPSNCATASWATSWATVDARCITGWVATLRKNSSIVVCGFRIQFFNFLLVQAFAFSCFSDSLFRTGTTLCTPLRSNDALSILSFFDWFVERQIIPLFGPVVLKKNCLGWLLYLKLGFSAAGWLIWAIDELIRELEELCATFETNLNYYATVLITVVINSKSCLFCIQKVYYSTWLVFIP